MKKCPVCNSKDGSDLMKDVACSVCGFEYAFVECFGSRETLKTWKTRITQEKKKYRIVQTESIMKGNRFVVNIDTVAFISERDRKLFVFGSDGNVQEKKNVRWYSRTDRNSAILYDDGKIQVEGDNTFAQCEIKSDASAVSVMCAPNCVYVLRDDGTVSVAGHIIDENILKWQGIRALACGSYHLLALKNDGTVRIAGDRSIIDRSMAEKVSGWRHVKAICAAMDYSCALHENGKVSFAGRSDDPRKEAESWENIVALKADSIYVVGLTNEGKIKLAGSVDKWLDMGRSSAAEWENVIAISCSKSGIAGIFNDGSLKIVGNFSGQIEDIEKQWKQHIVI